MSSNLSTGLIQVGSNDVASINIALAQVLEQLDHLRGLRGRAEIWDRVQVSPAAADSEAINLGMLDEREALFHLTFVAPGGASLLVRAPGTSYAEVSSLLRQQINFAVPVDLEARVIAAGFGTETGSTKGLALTDASGTVLAELTWDGASESTRVGSFSAIAADEDTLCQLRAKGSSSSESLIIHTVAVEFRLASGFGV